MVSPGSTQHVTFQGLFNVYLVLSAPTPVLESTSPISNITVVYPTTFSVDIVKHSDSLGLLIAASGYAWFFNQNTSSFCLLDLQSSGHLHIVFISHWSQKQNEINRTSCVNPFHIEWPLTFNNTKLSCKVINQIPLPLLKQKRCPDLTHRCRIRRGALS